mmetsp:Transcript_111428/g.240068  ORF Transcript_111428/g.240068 Transcript_111428/m.240068 type:complete len:322 (+) Transcript_111428:95-1060(+)
MSKESGKAMPPPLPTGSPLPPGVPHDLPALLPNPMHDGSLARKRIHYEDGEPLKATSKDSSNSASTSAGSKLDNKLDSAAAEWFYVQFEREESNTAQAMMGSVWRSCITGQVFTQQDIDYPTYKFADFFTRDFIKGSIPALQQDKYLFRPVLLGYRTWMYHDFFGSKLMINQGGGSEFAVLQHVLNHRTVDLELWAGRFSPLMVYAPMMLLLALTGDIYAVLAGLIVNWLLWLIATSTNTPVMHRYHRVFSFPLRAAFLVFILLRFGAATEGLGILAFVLCIVAMLSEMLCGDVRTILSYRLECTYEIVRVLPNRVFICRR